MKSLDQLIDLADPAIPLINEWVLSAKNHCELLPPSANRADVLLKTQVSTRSTMGAIAYETGGVLVDHGWLRFLGSGHAKLTRTLCFCDTSLQKLFAAVASPRYSSFDECNWCERA